MPNKNLTNFLKQHDPFSDLEFIQSITIPKYIVKMKTSDKQRRRYYKYDKSNSKWKPRPLPKTYKTKLDEGIYSLDSQGYLLKQNKDRKLANPRSAGTPNYEYYSGNRFASGMHYQLRNNLVNNLKDFYRPFVSLLKPINEFPIRVFWFLNTTLDSSVEWDGTNMWFYYKYFEDCLFEWRIKCGNKIKVCKNKKDANKKIKYYKNAKLLKPIIPDDNWKYVTQPGIAPIICPVEKWKDRSFIFQFYKDNRDIIKTNSNYSKK